MKSLSLDDLLAVWEHELCKIRRYAEAHSGSLTETMFQAKAKTLEGCIRDLKQFRKEQKKEVTP